MSRITNRYIILSGIHPFDLTGRATDAEVAEAICKREPPPLRNSPLTAHLSDSGTYVSVFFGQSLCVEKTWGWI
jgi:hypothetical protein